MGAHLDRNTAVINSLERSQKLEEERDSGIAQWLERSAQDQGSWVQTAINMLYARCENVM